MASSALIRLVALVVVALPGCPPPRIACDDATPCPAPDVCGADLFCASAAEGGEGEGEGAEGEGAAEGEGGEGEGEGAEGEGAAAGEGEGEGAAGEGEGAAGEGEGEGEGGGSFAVTVTPPSGPQPRALAHAVLTVSRAAHCDIALSGAVSLTPLITSNDVAVTSPFDIDVGLNTESIVISANCTADDDGEVGAASNVVNLAVAIETWTPRLSQGPSIDYAMIGAAQCVLVTDEIQPGTPFTPQTAVSNVQATHADGLATFDITCTGTFGDTDTARGVFHFGDTDDIEVLDDAVQVVTGNVNLTRPLQGNVRSLPTLLEADGIFLGSDVDGASWSVTLPALINVLAEIDVEHTTTLDSFSMDALTRAGDVFVDQNTSLAIFSARSLAVVVGDFGFVDDAITELDLPLLAGSGITFTVETTNPGFALSLPALANVGSSITFSTEDACTDLWDIVCQTNEPPTLDIESNGVVCAPTC